MKISLILGTYGRYSELERFLESLKAQQYKNFELILCDQNPEGFLIDVIKNYSPFFEIKHLITERGLSRARNAGIKVAEGDIFAFPDDDCVYPGDLLIKVKKIFEKQVEIDGIAGRPVSIDGGRMDQKFLKERAWVTKNNVFFTVVSYTLFLRRSLIESVGYFDEKLGVGSGTAFGSGEEVDFILRALEKNFKILYFPEIMVGHPSKDPALTGFTKEELKKAKSYNAGFAYILKKYDYSLSFKIKALIRPILGAIYWGLKGDFKRVVYQYYKFLGRIQGWF
jgi:glycosyltransferase involved in cell wall biosynthesis